MRIKNTRLSNNRAKSVPEPDPYFSNVSLLLHMDSISGSTLVDSSKYATNGTLITSNGALISTADKKFGASSLRYPYQDGWYATWAGSQFSVTTSEAFTIEFWWKHISNSYNSTLSPAIFIWRNAFGDSMVIFAHYASGNQYNLRVYTTDNYGTITLNQWNHIAFVLNAGNYALYINGVLAKSGAFSANTASGTFVLGNNNSSTPNYTADGYIDELRITKGIARYTANFTPPTEPFPDVMPDPYYNNVSLLLHMDGDGVNGNTYFRDDSQIPKTITAVGNAQISRTQSKFGVSSAYFNGSSNTYLSVPSNQAFNFGSEPFTIEGWIYPTSLSTFQGGIFTNRIAMIYGPINIRQSGQSFTALISNSVNDSWQHNISIPNVFTNANQWYHVAITGDSNNVYCFVNGILIDSRGPRPNWISSITPTFYMGQDGDGNFAGYIDEVRVTKGLARYTANFTPPALPFSNF